MSNDIKLDLTGDKQLLAKLKAMPGKVQKKIIREALREGAKITRAAVKARVPVDTGALAKSIKVRAAKRQRGRVMLLVSTTKKGNMFAGDTFYGGFVEYGYHIGARNNTIRSFRKNLYKKAKRAGDTNIQDQSITHSSDKRTFVEGQHFMRDGWETSKNAAYAKVESVLRSKISELAK